MFLGILFIIIVFGIYYGGGFVVELGYENEIVWKVIVNFIVDNWINRWIVIVLFEFVIFEFVINLFVFICYFFEWLFMGGMEIFYCIDFILFFCSISLYIGLVFIVCYVIIVLIFVYFIYIEICEMC